MIRPIPFSWTIPRETREWVGPIVVTVNGFNVTDFKVALKLDGTRPVVGDWQDPVVDGSNRGVMAGPGLPIGLYKIWVKYSTALEDIVLDDVGFVIIT